MRDDDLTHLCKLASIAVAMLGDDFDPRDLSDTDWHNTRNCLQILAKAYVGLLALSPEMKPAFRRAALRETGGK